MTPAGAPDLAILLDAIVRRHGPGVLDDRPKLFALLRDYAPAATRDIRVVMAAADCGITGRLSELLAPGAEDTVRAEAGRMTEAFGCQPDLAVAAVRTWARLSRSLADHPVGAGGVPADPLPAAAPVRPLPLAVLPIPEGEPRPAGRTGVPSGAGWLGLPAGSSLRWGLAALAVIVAIGIVLAMSGLLS